MADEGWIKLYRKITNSFVWTNSDQLKLWILVLTKANHTQNKFLFNGQEIRVTSGQFVTGAHALASEFNQGVPSDKAVVWRTLWRWLKKFEKEEMLTISSNARYSVVTVSKWGEYQSGDKPLTSHGQSGDKPLSTNKNEKNEKNDKNISTTTTDNVFDFFQQNGFGPISGFIAQDLDMWRDDFVHIGADKSTAEKIVIKSLALAAERNKRSWGYAKAILKSWHNDKLNSIEQIDAAQAAFEAKKPATNKSKPKTNNVYKERELTEEDLKWPKPKE